MTTMHFVGIIGTIIASLSIAIYSARNVKSADGFSLAGRKAGAPLVAGGIAGVIIGGGATVGTAQMAFQSGLSAWSYALGAGLAFLIQGLFYARPLRNTELETVPQFFALHYGNAKYADLPSARYNSCYFDYSASIEHHSYDGNNYIYYSCYSYCLFQWTER